MGEAREEIRIASLEVGADGIVRYTSRPGIRVDADDIRELLAALRRLGDGEALLVLSDIQGVKSVSGEARALGASDEAAALHVAAAIVVRSSLTRMIGNFFLRLNRPGYPTRLFNSSAAGLAWLHSFQHSEAEAS